MGLEEVKKEILDNARKQAKKIIDEAEAEKKEILKSANKNISNIKAQFDKDAVSNIQQYKLMSRAEIGSIEKKSKLNLEKELIKEVFDRTKDKLKKSTGKKREELFKALIVNTKFRYSKAYCAKQDAKLLRNSENVDIIGGVILENKEGNIRLDLSYETLLESIKQDYLSEIAKILFS